ncbi:MAG TPA: isocitrate/isopropylmalate family dehydrogenase [Nitrospiria bacterium]|nr:isocitrate/isopropylmalate family dehydrogenase [Nitrospiria bacterium]
MNPNPSKNSDVHRHTGRLSDFVFDPSVRKPTPDDPHLLGVLEGEGSGPEIIRATLQVLSALESSIPRKFDIRFGGEIGIPSELRHGKALCDDVINFCRDIFRQGGAVLAGPGGGRFVYDLRKQFDLFCKFSPLKVYDELSNAGRMKPEFTRHADLLLVRENVSGIYQGQWKELSLSDDGKKAEQSFHYTEKDVRRILRVAAGIAQHRRGEMTVTVKDAGIPIISQLWRDCTIEIASEAGVKYSFVNIDYAVYQLLQHAQDLDLIVSPNLFGDILADVGGILVGSRGITYSGNFSSTGAAVYQTNHGAAHDLKNTNTANPVGQIFSLAMLLRESFGLAQEARVIEDAVSAVWREGWRTADLTESGCRVAGTREIGERIAEKVTAFSKAIDTP